MSTLWITPMATAAITRDAERAHPGDHRGRERLGERLRARASPGRRRSTTRPRSGRPTASRARRRAPTPWSRPASARWPRAGPARGSTAHALTVLPIRVRSRNQIRASTATGTRIEHAEVRPPDAHAGDGPGPVERARDSGRWRRSVGGSRCAMAWASSAMPMVATSTTTRGAFFSRRMTVISTAAPKTQADDERDDQGDPEGHVVLEHQQRERHRPDHAHVADGEVDDPRGPVDEHDAHGDHGDGQALDDAVEDDLRVDPADGQHQAGDLAAQEDGPGQVVALHEVGDRRPRSAPAPSP